MSDASQGPGWWQASDGKWYPPEQAQGPQPAPAGGGGGGGAQSQWGTLADFGPRAIAYLIDFGLLMAIYIVGWIIGLIFSAVSDALGALVLFVVWLATICGWLYMGFLVGAKGRSPGMAIIGLRCVGEETGQVVGGGTGVIRTLAHIIDSIICYIGWLFPLWDDKRQTIADKVMKTVVLADQPKESFSMDLLKP